MTLLGEEQIEPGNPLYPLNEGFPPDETIALSAIASRWRVVTPGRRASCSRRSVSLTITPAFRMMTSSSGDFL